MDPLSDVLSLVKIREYRSGGLDVGGPWCIEFPRSDGVSFYAVVQGSCWLQVEGGAAPISVEAGDCLLLPNGRSFLVGSDLALPPAQVFDVFAHASDGVITHYQGGGDSLTICGHFTLAESQASQLLGVLPPLFHIRHDADRGMLRWTLERMGHELREPQPGGSLIAQQLATMVLVQAIRLHLASGATEGMGWLFAVADKKLGAAIRAMHEQPAHRWTLEALAERAGMSRTAFAVKFKEAVGTSPIDYLIQWRMLLAKDRLAHTGDSISEIAQSLGYESESAFSTAFKRVMGSSPRRYEVGQISARVETPVG